MGVDDDDSALRFRQADTIDTIMHTGVAREEHTSGEADTGPRHASLRVLYPTKADAVMYQSLYYLELLLRLQRRSTGSKDVENEIQAVVSINGPIVQACALLHIHTVESLVRRLDALFIDSQACYDAIALVESRIFNESPAIFTQIRREDILSSLYVLIGLLNDTSRAIYCSEVYSSLWRLVKQIDYSGNALCELSDARNAFVSILRDIYAHIDGQEIPDEQKDAETVNREQHLMDYPLRRRTFEQILGLYRSLLTQRTG